jgi:hypothetical protein
MATDYERAVAILTGAPDPGASIDQFIQEATAKLGVDAGQIHGEPASEGDDVVDAPDASVVNAILARAAAARQRKKEAEAEYNELIGLLKATVGEHDALRVHGAVVFTYKRSTSRLLNQQYIKSRFPDIAGNEDFYTDSERRTALLK